MNESPQRVLWVGVLDQSSSMMSLTDITLEGFNGLIMTQKAEPIDCYMSLTLFDSDLHVVHVGTPLVDVPLLDRSTYRCRANTKLFDALGTSIKGAEAWIAAHPGAVDKVLVTTWTDGQENESREWHINHPRINGDDRDLLGLIEYKQNEGWEFMFLGTGGSDWLERTFGSVVAVANIVGTGSDHVSHHNSYAGVANAMTATRTKGVSYAVSDHDRSLMNDPNERSKQKGRTKR